MKNSILIYIFILVSWFPIYGDSKLSNTADKAFLTVNGEPMLILGGELGNSSATCCRDIEENLSKLATWNLNTVLVPVYWDLTEPQEGKFDYTLTDKVIDTVKENGLKVVFLWFGAWKNSMSCYAPIWVKTDYERFPRARTETGKPLEIVSAFSPEV